MDASIIWTLLGVITIIPLIMYWDGGPNSVWGGLTLGAIIGAIVAFILYLSSGEFDLLIPLKGGIVGTLAGWGLEVIFHKSKYHSVKSKALPQEKIKLITYLYNNRKNEEVLPLLDDAINKGYTSGDIYSMRAFTLQALKYDLDAIDDFNEAIKLEQDDANLYFGRSMSKDSTGDIDGCISDLRTAVSLSLEDNDRNRQYNETMKSMGWESANELYKHTLQSKLLTKDSDAEMRKLSAELAKGMGEASRYPKVNLRRREK
jgi:tetratricopeptide (TPR) repeat protein